MKTLSKVVYFTVLILNISCSEGIKISMVQSIAFKHPVTHISILQKQIAYVVNNEIYIATLNKNNLLDENKSGIPKNAICLSNKFGDEFEKSRTCQKINAIHLIPNDLILVSFEESNRLYCLNYKKHTTYYIPLKEGNIISLNLLSDHQAVILVSSAVIIFKPEVFYVQSKKSRSFTMKIDEKIGFNRMHTFGNTRIVINGKNKITIFDLTREEQGKINYVTNDIKSAYFLNENELLVLKEKNIFARVNIPHKLNEWKTNIPVEISSVNILSKNLVSLTLENKVLCFLGKTKIFNSKQKLNLKFNAPISEDSFAAICEDELCIFKTTRE